MGIFSTIFGGGVAQPIEAIGNVLDKVMTSEDEKLAAQAVMIKIQQQPHILQAEITKLEASHRSTFVSGARPAILWVCALGLLTSYVISPWMQWLGYPSVDLPLDHIMNLVLAIIGLGGLRSAEKLAGKAR